MISKNILVQYCDLQKEAKESRDKIDKQDLEITKLERSIKKIEQDGNVTDMVSGGDGGIQHFKIEGFPYPEYERKKSILLQKRILLERRKTLLEDQELNLLETLNEVEEYISTIEDSRMRRIINMRLIDCLSWSNVAKLIGGNNTEDSVRMAFNRFFEEK